MQPELDVLQHLAMEGIAETDDIAEATGHPEGAVRDTLDSLEAEGFVEAEGFWYLTDSGEDRLGTVCRQRFDAEELAALEDLLPRFETLDDRMKELAGEWQDLDQSDRGPAAEPVDALEELHADLEALFTDLEADTRAIYDPYLESLSDAVTRLRDGETAYFTATDVDSYHTVWFELHDDLLRTLGVERSA